MQQAARDRLTAVRRNLETGQAINHVPGEIAAVLHAVMEAWLQSQDIQPDFGNGVYSLQGQFLKHAPQLMSSDASSLLTRLARLENELLGDSEGLSPSRPFDMPAWKADIRECLDQTEQLLAGI